MTTASGIEPSAEQKAILDLGLTSIKVRAGAGTGKTTTVAMVIANLVANHDVEPEQVLGMTFTNKAAGELADRVRQMIGGDEPGRQAEVHTYHGFAAQILAEFAPLAGVDKRVRVITPTFARQLLEDAFRHQTYKHLDITWRGSLEPILKLGDRLGDHLKTPDEILRSEPRGEIQEKRFEMAEVLSRYNEDKRQLGVVDYSDLIILAAGIVAQHPHLAEMIRGRYRVVVLDEYQDTNPAQRVLLEAIFGNGFPVIAVGDEDQTIYEWRGASTENFEKFEEQFRTPEGGPAHLLGLTLNRRSTQPILDIANSVRGWASDDAHPLVSATEDATGTEVVTYWAADAIAEAEWIATSFERLHDEGVPWRDMAVLFRKNSHFPVIVDTLSKHDIPIEVANVGGLLSVPEVAELVAWLRIVEHPDDSTALTQILFGSRYRLGMADLAPLVRSAAPGRLSADDSDYPDPLTLIETLEDLDRVDGLRTGAREALEHFHDIYRQVLLDSQGLNLVEVCRLILDLTGAWRDTEALPSNARLTARLNLYRMLDLAGDWSPLRGRTSLGAFLDYLHDMEDDSIDELDAARLSGADAVTLVTVHRAKGLEWENVAIPALTKGDFPSSVRVLEDPDTKAQFLPGDLRIDNLFSGMPPSGSHRDAFLRQRHDRQEWRVAYVAVTRAGKRLFVSGSYWYGRPEPTKHPKQPSELWHLINEHPNSISQGFADPVERPEVLGAWTEGPTPDPIFPGGWDNALRMAMDDPNSIEALASALGVAEEYRGLVEETEGRLFALNTPGLELVEDDTSAVSVTGLVTYAQCPKRFYWSDIDPLPRRRNLAAARGTDIHRRIELHQRGQASLDLVDGSLYDMSQEEITDTPVGPAPFDNYIASRFSERKASMVETPFSLDLPTGYKLRGRIDAVYIDGRHWEVVDFKSGRVSSDPSRVVQLQAYAVAVADVDFGWPTPEVVDVTFSYLGGGGDEVTYRADHDWITTARGSMNQITADISAGNFSERPGPWCANCDFLRFCEPGRREIGR